MHGDIFRRVVPLVLAARPNIEFNATSNVRSNSNIALTVTLFRWVSGEMLALHNVADISQLHLVDES